MENFILAQNSLNDNNASCELPLLIDVLKGKNGQGMSVCSKVGSQYHFSIKTISSKRRINFPL